MPAGAPSPPICDAASARGWRARRGRGSSTLFSRRRDVSRVTAGGWRTECRCRRHAFWSAARRRPGDGRWLVVTIRPRPSSWRVIKFAFGVEISWQTPAQRRPHILRWSVTPTAGGCSPGSSPAVFPVWRPGASAGRLGSIDLALPGRDDLGVRQPAPRVSGLPAAAPIVAAVAGGPRRARHTTPERTRSRRGLDQSARAIWGRAGLRWTAVVTVALALGFYAQFESGLPRTPSPTRRHSAGGRAVAVNLPRHHRPGRW